MPSGRLFGVKKSTILRSFTLLFFLFFVGHIFFCVFSLKKPDLWFYGFCFFVGAFQLLKGFLFKIDSCIYLGTLLFGIGAAGHIFLLTNTAFYAPYFLSAAFVVASIVTFIVCGQRFHLVVAFSTFYVALYAFLLTKNLINLSILIAFVAPFLLLLLLEILILCFHKK